MAITLPLPVRVAAGLLATGIQLVRSLPEEIPAIPVTLVGNAMRLSMKVHQEITTLATRGDELLGGIVGSRPQESPTWATFDEDPAPPAAQARSRPARPRSAPAGPPGKPAAEPPVPNPATAAPPTVAPAPAAAGAEPAEAPEPDEPVRHTPEETSLSETDTTATEAAEEVPDAVVEAAMQAVPDPVPAESLPTEPTPTESLPTEPTPTEPTPAEPTPTEPKPDQPAEQTTQPASPDGPAEPIASTDDPGRDPADAPAADDSAPTDDEDDGPAVLPGYDRMTLAQVRGHLRELSGADVSALLAYEQAGDNRAPFLTLLSNRLVTLGARES